LIYLQSFNNLKNKQTYILFLKLKKKPFKVFVFVFFLDFKVGESVCPYTSIWERGISLTWKNPKREKKNPFFLFSFSFLIGGSSKWRKEGWEKILFPRIGGRRIPSILLRGDP